MSRSASLSLFLAGCLVGGARADDRRPDLVVADFEGAAYAPGWVAAGTAFGAGPAPGTLPGQMTVEGFEGHGLVDSYLGGDDAEGTLTSPPFRVERRYLNFLVGGGKFPGQTCVDLLVDGKAVRTATGPNDRPGGSERLAWATWDVAEFAGRVGTLRIIDARRGGWGHINLDQVVQADERRQDEPTTRTIVADARYLHLPVRAQDPVRRVAIARRDGTVVREFDIRLADGAADFATVLDLAPFRGEALTITATLPGSSRALDAIARSDAWPDAAALYGEADRPRFHFTSRRGWLNDPNGLVWHAGQYHLFYQHNPYGWEWGNMHWGHATSPDLVRWVEQPIALYPPRYGDMCFSGSAVVDRENTSGFGTAEQPALVAAFTSTGRGECIVSSRDAGQTWAEFAGNPVVRHEGRDPRLFRHEPTRRWIMAVYDEANHGQAIVIHSSPDLKTWTEESRIDGFFECPDLFELPVLGGEADRSLWVLSAADGKYRLGQFDGHRFTPETDKLTTWHGDFYAAQTFTNAPDRRRLQIGWARDIAFPGMPFNQQMTIPCELTLRATPAGPRLRALPVAEVAQLYDTARPGTHAFRFQSPGAGRYDETLMRIETADALDLTVNVVGDPAGEVVATFGGAPVRYDGARKLLEVAGLAIPIDPAPAATRLRILADRRSLEVFLDDGAVAVSRRVARRAGTPALELAARGSRRQGVRINAAALDLKSAW